MGTNAGEIEIVGMDDLKEGERIVTYLRDGFVGVPSIGVVMLKIVSDDKAKGGAVEANLESKNRSIKQVDLRDMIDAGCSVREEEAETISFHIGRI